MSRNFFEELKKTILDETNVPDAHVSNLHGTPPAGRVMEDSRGSQTWFLFSVDAGELPTLRQFTDLYTDQRTGHQTLAAPLGEVHLSGMAPGQVHMLYTTTVTSGPVRLPIELTAPGYEYAIYQGSTLLARGENFHEGRHDLPGGRHPIAILLRGGSGTVQVRTPPNITLAPQEILPETPVLLDPLAYYLEEHNGSFVVELNWYNTPDASGWQVYRSDLFERGSVTDVEDEEDGSYTLTISMEEFEELAPGEQVYLDGLLVGTVLSAETDEDDLTITAQIAPEEGSDPNEWEGTDYMRPGPLQPITRLSYSGNHTIQWLDTSVRRGRTYIYAVTALGFIDGSTESEYSDRLPVYVQDVDPPSNVTQVSTSTINARMTVVYTAPTDPDYRATRLYRETSPGQYTAMLTDYGQPGEPSQFSFEPGDAATFWLRTLDWAGNEQSQGVSFEYDGDPHWRDSLHGSCVIRIISSESDDVYTVVQVHAVPGTGTVELVDVSDNVTWVLTDPDYADTPGPHPSGTKWKFRRPLYGRGLGEVIFKADVPGYTPDENHIVLSEIGQDTIGLTLKVELIDSTETERIYRVSVGDPEDPQRPDDGVEIRYTAHGVNSISPGTPQTIPANQMGRTPEESIAEGGFILYTIEKPPFGSGGGRVVFSAHRGESEEGAGFRLQDIDPVEIPELPAYRPTVSIAAPVILLGEAAYIVSALNVQGGTTGLEWRHVYWWAHTEHPGWPNYSPMPNGLAMFVVPRHARFDTHVEVQVRDSTGKTARELTILRSRDDTPPENDGNNQWSGAGYDDEDSGPGDETRII